MRCIVKCTVPHHPAHSSRPVPHPASLLCGIPLPPRKKIKQSRSRPVPQKCSCGIPRDPAGCGIPRPAWGGTDRAGLQSEPTALTNIILRPVHVETTNRRTLLKLHVQSSLVVHRQHLAACGRNPPHASPTSSFKQKASGMSTWKQQTDVNRYC